MVLFEGLTANIILAAACHFLLRFCKSFSAYLWPISIVAFAKSRNETDKFRYKSTFAVRPVDGVGYNLNRLGGPREYHPPHFLISTARNLGLIIFFSILVFACVNLPAYWAIAKYRFSPPSEETILAKSDELKANLVTQYPNNTLVIPKINLQAPVNWETSEADVMSALERGVVHIKGSGLPGDKKSVFITGHSSNYWWKSGDFNTVFALLPELTVDDEVFIAKDGKITRYKVTERIEVGKKEVASYAERKEEELTLMTCYPVGTNLRRLLVIARPI